MTASDPKRSFRIRSDDTLYVSVYYRLTKNKSNSQGQNMSDKSRRKLLKSIAAGSGAIVAGKSLPESWSRPVVDSVMLPAHAQTSPAQCAGVYSGLANGTNGPFAVCTSAGSVSTPPQAVQVTIDPTGQITGTYSGLAMTLISQSGNSFTLERGIGISQSNGTSCVLYAVLNGVCDPNSGQIDVSEIYEWRCTGTITCTNQLDAGTFILTRN